MRAEKKLMFFCFPAGWRGRRGREVTASLRLYVLRSEIPPSEQADKAHPNAQPRNVEIQGAAPSSDASITRPGTAQPNGKSLR